MAARPWPCGCAATARSGSGHWLRGPARGFPGHAPNGAPRPGKTPIFHRFPVRSSGTGRRDSAAACLPAHANVSARYRHPRPRTQSPDTTRCAPAVLPALGRHPTIRCSLPAALLCKCRTRRGRAPLRPARPGLRPAAPRTRGNCRCGSFVGSRSPGAAPHRESARRAVSQALLRTAARLHASIYS